MALGINDREHWNQLWVGAGFMLALLVASSGGIAWFFALNSSQTEATHQLEMRVTTLEAQHIAEEKRDDSRDKRFDDFLRDYISFVEEERKSTADIGQDIRNILIALPTKENIHQR